MYTIEIQYKGNEIEYQIELDRVKDYIPTLSYEHGYSAQTGRTTQKWVVLRVSKPLIQELHDLLPFCTTEITELVKGKQSINVDDFL